MEQIKLNFFYDGQIRRYLLQFIRVFSDISIETGTEDGGKVQTRVPIVYGDPSWMVAQIIKGQSQNTTLPSPMMAAWIADLQMAPERRRDPAFEGHKNAIERKFENGEYTEDVGNRFTVERYMPVPYTLTFQLDIWTTTTTTKLQILEQIMTVFNPSMQLQQTDNHFDWTAIFELELTQVVWSNRGIPNGTEMERDVASFQFTVPIWINPPAKLKSIKVIEQIVTNIHNVAEIDRTLEDPLACLSGNPEQMIVTPGQYRVSVGENGLAPNEVMLLDSTGNPQESLTWESLFALYGSFDADNSVLRLKLVEDIENFDYDILGTITIDENRPNVAIYNIDPDTLPSTIGMVDRVVDPHNSSPNKELPAAAAGQRYLLTSDWADGEEGVIPDDGLWGDLQANENDIIEYNGAEWVVVFNSLNEASGQHIVMSGTGRYLSFNGEDWEYTYQGEYCPGYWRLENMFADSGWNEETDPPEEFPGDNCKPCDLKNP